jgi:hypothetical protein
MLEPKLLSWEAVRAGRAKPRLEPTKKEKMS